jgi:tryptophan-rich sensory protein
MGSYFPPSKTNYQPIFQPPSIVFSLMWTYITLAFGGVTASVLQNENANKFTIIMFYLVLLLTLNSWLVLNYFNHYQKSFYLLLTTTFIAISYLSYLATINTKYFWFLLPLPLWLVIATALNATIYDYYAKQ